MQESIVFFGSGPVAAESLRLLAQDFTVEAVVTKPKPTHHKGDFPVLKVAEELGLQVLLTAHKKDLLAVFADKPVSSRLGVVIDYGIIIPQSVIDYFPLGIVNSHFSLLPQWRGADPISFSILSGQQQTGVSLMVIVAALDEGPLLAESPFELSDSITTPELTEHLINLSHAMLVDALPRYVSGEISPAEQAEATIAEPPEASYSRKLEKSDSQLDFNKPAEQLEREIRAFIEWPRSRTTLGGHQVIVTKATIEDGIGDIGTVHTDQKRISIQTSDGRLVIEQLIPNGKKTMPAQAFLAGYTI